MKPPSSAGATPPLPSSPATLTSTRTSVSGLPWRAELLERRVGGDRVDQAAERQQLLHLAALQVADEVPARRRRPSARAWRARSCWRFSPTRVDPGLGERPHLLERHVLGRDEDLDPVAGDLARPARGWRATLAGVDAVDQARHLSRPSIQASAGLAAGARRRRGGGRRRAPARSSCRARPPRPARRRRRRAAAGRPRAGRASGRRRLRRRGRRRRRGPRRRPRSSRDRSRDRSRRRSRRPPRRPRATIPAASPRQPQWSIATPPGPRGRPGRQSAMKTSGARPGSVATWPSTSADLRAGRGERARDLRLEVDRELGAVDLAADQRPARARGRARRRAGAGSRPRRSARRRSGCRG